MKPLEEQVQVAGLEIALFGAPRVAVDGAPIAVDTRKATALLAWLALSGTPQRRDTLAALLWPDADDARARGALRRTLSALTTALQGRWLRATREEIALGDDDVWFDVAVFRRRLAESRDATTGRRRAALAEAVGLARDGFMAGFSLRDAPAFDDWQRDLAEQLRDELATALEQLAALAEDAGDLRDAIAHARRRLALDPLHEDAHRALMRLYAAAGQQAAALRQYQECARILDEELGVEPLEATTALYREIQQRRDLPASRSAPVAATEPAQAFPLVGRGDELRQIATAYARAAASTQLVIVEGEAGIGKSRLIETSLAPLSGAAVLTLRCYEGEAQMALRPLADALRAALARPEQASRMLELPAQVLADVSRLLPRLAELRPGLPAPEPLDSPIAQVRFFDALHDVLLTLLAGARPGVLVVEDAHWIDGASLDFLGYVMRRLDAQPLLVLLSLRPGESPDEQRLRQLGSTAARRGAAVTLALTRLSLEDVRALARPIARDAAIDHAALTERLHQETQGLPYFLVEYLGELLRNPSAAGGASWPVPGGVRELLRARVAGVAAVESQLLTTLAAVGRACGFELLAAASGRSEAEAAEALEQLLARGLVVERSGDAAGEPQYDLGHDRLRELLYADMTLLRRRLLHRRIADALQARARRAAEPALSAQIAQHYQLAGRDAEAADAFREAGDAARRIFANAEAAAHYESALALGHPEPALLRERLGDALVQLGQYDRALASYERAAALSGAAASPELARRMGQLYQRIGEWTLAEQQFATASEALDIDASARARLLADWSLTAHRRGDDARATQLAGESLQLAEAYGDRTALTQAHNLLGILARARGDLPRARAELEASLRLAASAGDDGARVAALNNLALVELAAGDLARAEALTRDALELCMQLGDRHREAALHSNLADVLHANGERDAAHEHLRRSATIYAEIGQVAGEPQPEIWKLVEW